MQEGRFVGWLDLAVAASRSTVHFQSLRSIVGCGTGPECPD
jgi:hypothetical protein